MSAVRKQPCALVLITDRVRIPVALKDLSTFRRWATSNEFPEQGRIDFIGGDVEIDMSPEDLGTHGTPKGDVFGDLRTEVRSRGLGLIWVDRARLSNAEADLSSEPDVVLCLRETLESGNARLVPKSGREPGRYVEIEGMADLVVEVISDSSEKKDRERLRSRYYRAGVREYWLIDARGKSLVFQVLRRGQRDYVAVRADRRGFLRSAVLDRRVRLTRRPGLLDVMEYSLEIRPA